jgi:hypothetical protein
MLTKLTRIMRSRERGDARYKSSWKPKFAKAYETAFKAFDESNPGNDRYIIHHELGVCSCPSFLTSRFLICKHVCGPANKDDTFFHNVSRERLPPFWIVDPYPALLHGSSAPPRPRAQPERSTADVLADGLDPMSGIDVDRYESADEVEVLESWEAQREQLRQLTEEGFAFISRQEAASAQPRAANPLLKTLKKGLKNIKRREGRVNVTWAPNTGDEMYIL